MKYLKTYEEKKGISFQEWLKTDYVPGDHEVYCVGMGLTDLDGIEKMVHVDEIWCSWNDISRLDLRNLTNLKDLTCSNNNLNYLNVSGLDKITRLLCEKNPELKEIIGIEDLVNLRELKTDIEEYKDLKSYWKWFQKEHPDRWEAMKFNF